MVVYRINDCSFINDLTGKGAAMYGGRWNSKDTYMVYTATSRALALLEVVVHMGKIPIQGYCMANIEIPKSSIKTILPDKLPSDWFSNPPPDYLKAIGDDFILASKYLGLQVPSVVMMEENNLLLNPSHPDFKKVKILAQRPVRMDERLFPLVNRPDK